MRFANLVCDRDDFNFVKGDVYNDRMKTLITHKSILYNVFQSPRLNYLYTLFYLFCFLADVSCIYWRDFRKLTQNLNVKSFLLVLFLFFTVKRINYGCNVNSPMHDLEKWWIEESCMNSNKIQCNPLQNHKTKHPKIWVDTYGFYHRSISLAGGLSHIYV